MVGQTARVQKRTQSLTLYFSQGCCCVSDLEQAGAHNDILVSTIGQERGGGAGAEGTELNHMDVVLTRHRVSGTAAQILLHAVDPGRQSRGLRQD